MKHDYKYFILLVSTTGMLLLPGCMGGIATPTPSVVNSSNQEEMVTFDPDDGIADLSERIEKMKQDKVSFYAPNSANLINEKFATVLQYKKEGASEEKLYIEIKKVDGLIDSAYSRKKIVSSKMDDSLEHYNTLLALKSNVYFAGRFESLRDDMQKIIRNYDNLGGLFSSSEPKIEAFEDVPELNRNMLALEIDTVLSKEYTPNEIKLSQMKDNDFNEYAPKTYNAAQLKLVEFKTYIKAHHLDRDGIVKRKASLEFEYSHLAHVVNEVKYLKHEDDDEKVVLDQEAKYLTLMNSLEMSDSRDKPTEAQYQMIVAGIDNIKVTATVGITQNITKIATLEKELEALKLEAKTYKEEELVAKTTAEELNMEMMTVKMEVENLSKELEKQKQLNEELATKKLEDLYTPEEKKQEVVVEIPTAENKEEIK